MEILQELYLSDMEYKWKVGAVERSASYPALRGQGLRRRVAPTDALAAFAAALIVAVIAV